jgi:hypothetical protein
VIPLLEAQQTQKAAAGNNWRDLLKLIEAIPSRVHDKKMHGDVLRLRTRSASNAHPRVCLLNIGSIVLIAGSSALHATGKIPWQFA